MYLFIYLFVCLFVCLSIYLFVYLFIYLFIYLWLTVLQLKISVPQKYTKSEYLYIRYMLINVNQTIKP